MTVRRNFDDFAGDQVFRLRTIAELDGSEEAMADFGAARLTQRAGKGRNVWFVARHESSGLPHRPERRYLSEPDRKGERIWTDLTRAGAFAGYNAARTAIARAGEGVAIPARAIEFQTFLQPSGRSLGGLGQ